MRDLTGAPAFEHVIEKTEDIFEKILEADSKNWCIASGTGDSGENLEDLGLVAGHAYGIISAATVEDADGNEVKLLKMRNPWGKFEWNGDWGDSSDKWTPELREQLGQPEEAQDDGAFWINFEDYKNYFGRV